MQFPAWKYPIHWLAHGFGLGLAPFAAGIYTSGILFLAGLGLKALGT